MRVHGLEGSPPDGCTSRGAATRTITDGPFAETKGLIGGDGLLEVGSIDAAVEWMKRVPLDAKGGEREIRRLVDLGDAPQSEEATAMHARLEQQVSR